MPERCPSRLHERRLANARTAIAAAAVTGAEETLGYDFGLLVTSERSDFKALFRAHAQDRSLETIAAAAVSRGCRRSDWWP